MSRLLKQSTAFTFRVGPFLDSTDGVTAETALTIAQADIQISKNGGAFAQTSATPTTTHDTDGWYQCPLTTTDTGTLGPLTVQITMTGALPVWEHFLVVPANVYDSLVAATDTLQADVTQLAGVAQSLTDLKDFADAGYDPATNKVAGVVLVDTVTTNTDMRGTDSALLASNVPANFADLAVTAGTGKVTVGTNGDKTGYSISGTKTTLDALNDTSTAQVNAEVDTALNTAIPGAPTADSINERVKAIDDKLPTGTLSDFNEASDKVTLAAVTHTGATVPTVTTLTGHTPQTGDNYARLGAPAGASVSADVAAVKVDTAAVLDDTGTSGVVVASASKTGYELSAAGVDGVLDEVYEGTTTLRQFLRLAASALWGKLSGAATTTVAVRDEADTKDRITATVDADGNRSAVTLDKS